MKKLLAVAVLAVSLSGCKSLNRDYVAADEATYSAIEADHRAYVGADPKLSDEQKVRRIRLIDSWRERIDAAKESLK
jgi:hypothetical protein